MSISPAISFTTIPQTSSQELQSPGESQAPHPQNAASPPESGTVSKAEVQVPKNDSAPSQLPEDEVQLQRDSELENELIVRYMDKAGNLILQMPGEQLLNFERAIAAEFQHPKPQAAASTGEKLGQSGDSHGN